MNQNVEHDRRDLAGPAVLSEPQPLGELVLTVLRYLPAVIPFAILMAAAAYYVTTPSQPRAVASSEIGLTGKVVWPFFDAARLRAVTTFEEPEFQATVADSVGGLTIEELWIEMPDNQAYVAINATSDSASNAAVIVNTAADMLLERDFARQSAEAQARLEEATAVLDASQARIDQLNAQLADFVVREAETRAALAANPLSVEARQAVLSIDVERTGVDQALAEELRLQVQLQIDRDQAQSAVEAVTPSLELLRRSNATDEPLNRSYVPVVAALIAAMAIGLGAALVWDRSRGRLRSTWQAEHVSGVPVMAEIRSGKNWRPSIDVFLADLADAAIDDHNIVAMTGLQGAQTRRWLKMVVHYFEVSSLRVVALAHSADDDTPLGAGDEIKWNIVEDSVDIVETLQGVSSIILPPDLTVLDSALMRPILHDIADYCDIVLLDGGEIGQDASDQALALADLSLLMAARRIHRVDQLRKAVAHVESRRSRFLGVVLATSRPPKAKYKRVDDDENLVSSGSKSDS
jgi:hypothetical protein